MTKDDNPVTVNAKKITGKDRAVIGEIAKCGFVSLDLDGKPALEVKFEVSPYRMQRLIALGLLEPSGDALFPDAPSQTWKLTQAAQNGA